MMKRVGFFCALLFLAACRSTGAEVNQNFQIDYPDTDPARVVLEIATGTLNLTTDESSGVSGVATTNVGAWRVSTSSAEDGSVRVTQGESRTQVIPDAANVWDMALGKGQPITLAIDSESAGGNLSLDGLGVRDLEITGVSGSYTLDYPSPSAVEDGGTLSIALTSGSVEVSNALNSHAHTISSTTASGMQTWQFNGDGLIQDMLVSLETRTGEVIIRIPNGLPVRAVFMTTSGVVREVSPEFVSTGAEVWETAEYADDSQPRLQLQITTVTGDLRLISVPVL